jgi:hypothetical protein
MHFILNRMRSIMRNIVAGSQSKGAVRLILEDDVFRRVEEWRRSHPKIPPRATAIRQLIERGLAQDSGSSAKTRDAMARASKATATQLA